MEFFVGVTIVSVIIFLVGLGLWALGSDDTDVASYIIMAGGVVTFIVGSLIGWYKN